RNVTGVQTCALPIYEADDAAVEVVVLFGSGALVVQRQPKTLVEVRRFAEPLRDDRGVPLDHREHLFVRREARDGPGDPRRLAPLDRGWCWQLGLGDRADGARRFPALVRLGEHFS